MKILKCHMVMNPESKTMVFDLSTKFDTANELQDMFKAMSQAGELSKQGAESPGGNPLASMGDDGATDVEYSFNGTVFKRLAKIIDQEKHAQAVDSLGQSAMMFGSSKYTIKYHFPRPIKSVSKEGALYSEDRKTVTLEVGFLEVLKDPELLDFEVTLEDK
ncbi:MAG: hypothetical protein WA775_16200 [Psychroserpens sp.]|uniref:hypothetical protein n=1 Tax=Psychroserpens sp. TaxID=2020870 RepID=UPI003C98DAF5